MITLDIMKTIDFEIVFCLHTNQLEKKYCIVLDNPY